MSANQSIHSSVESRDHEGIQGVDSVDRLTAPGWPSFPTVQHAAAPLINNSDARTILSAMRAQSDDKSKLRCIQEIVAASILQQCSATAGSDERARAGARTGQAGNEQSGGDDEQESKQTHADAQAVAHCETIETETKTNNNNERKTNIDDDDDEDDDQVSIVEQAGEQARSCADGEQEHEHAQCCSTPSSAAGNAAGVCAQPVAEHASGGRCNLACLFNSSGEERALTELETAKLARRGEGSKLGMARAETAECTERSANPSTCASAPIAKSRFRARESSNFNLS